MLNNKPTSYRYMHFFYFLINKLDNQAIPEERPLYECGPTKTLVSLSDDDDVVGIIKV